MQQLLSLAFPKRTSQVCDHEKNNLKDVNHIVKDTIIKTVCLTIVRCSSIKQIAEVLVMETGLNSFL
jgi:hypothetical protein